MPRLLLTIVALVLATVPVVATDSWSVALKRGDYAEAATLLQRAVFEPPQTGRPGQAATPADPVALKELAALYADGKGVARDEVLACGLARAHAAAVARGKRLTAATSRATQNLVEKYCGSLPPADRAAAFATMTCPRIGLDRHAPIQLDKGWSIQFNDRSATIARDGQVRDQALPGDLVCRAQVLLLRHSRVGGKGARHVIEQVTAQSAWRGGVLTREIVWQLYEVRGLELDLAAVQRWQEPGSAWPAPPLPEAIARGVTFTMRSSGEIDYAIADELPRRGTIPPSQGLR